MIDPNDVEVLRFEGRRSTGVWGAAAGAGVMAIVLAYFLYGYLYLSVSNDDWPPPGVADPPLARPAALLGLVALGTGIAVWTARPDRQADFRGPRAVALAIVAVLGTAFVALGAAHVSRMGLEPRDQAYGAITTTVHAVQGAVTAAGVAIAGLTAFEAHRLGRHAWVAAASVVTAIWWGAVLAGWVAVFGVVYVWPQWS